MHGPFDFVVSKQAEETLELSKLLSKCDAKLDPDSKDFIVTNGEVEKFGDVGLEALKESAPEPGPKNEDAKVSLNKKGGALVFATAALGLGAVFAGVNKAFDKVKAAAVTAVVAVLGIAAIGAYGAKQRGGVSGHLSPKEWGDNLSEGFDSLVVQNAAKHKDTRILGALVTDSPER